ncbi:MAG: glutaredoxin-like protein NrdH [Arthrobacter sp.]
MTVTVYTTPSCQQCNMTKRWLTKNNIPFEAVDLTQSPEAAAMVKGLGFTSAPVVVAGNDTWFGFRPDLLAPLAAA